MAFNLPLSYGSFYTRLDQDGVCYKVLWLAMHTSTIYCSIHIMLTDEIVCVALACAYLCECVCLYVYVCM